MTYARQANSYREMEVMSATPGRLLLMLFDHLAQQLMVAKIAMEQNDIERRTVALMKARADVAELLSSLDLEKGGSLAANLSSLYRFVLAELTDVGVRRDLKMLAQLTAIVTTLQEGFRGAVAQIESGAARGAAPALARSA
jgi:flagellar protein FliS